MSFNSNNFISKVSQVKKNYKFSLFFFFYESIKEYFSRKNVLRVIYRLFYRHRKRYEFGESVYINEHHCIK